MPRASWLLVGGQPVIEIELQEKYSGFTFTRALLADTGGGSASVAVDLVLSQTDGARCGGKLQQLVSSGGAIHGSFEVRSIEVAIPTLNLKRRVNVMLVPAETLPDGLQGIACFRFLNSFTYGNFGNPAEFGLETI